MLFFPFRFFSMDTNITPVDEIVPGKIDWCIRARVVHLWKVPNNKNRDEVIGIEFLLLDEKVVKHLYVG